MAGEVQASYQAARTLYFLTRNAAGQIWNTSGTGAFESYATSKYASYAISMSEQGTASAYYTGDFPTAIPAGVYNVVAKNQVAGSGVETDPTVAQGDLQWNGTTVLPLSNLLVSGQIGPIKLTRSQMVQNFPIYLKSAADHITPFTSGTVSGQISRDGGNFGPLQSGAFTEVGQGFYNLQALTSGDLNANTVALQFNAVNAGGASDPLPMAFVMQKSSGY